MGDAMSVVEGEGYRVVREAEANRVVFEGTLRLGGLGEYAPIADLLNAALAAGDVTVDVKALEFLNSSGIAMLSKFVIQARGLEGTSVRMLGDAGIPWQGKSLNNLKRLLPTLQLEID